MKVAFLARYSARDVHGWSGLGYFLTKALERNGVEVEYIDSLPSQSMFSMLFGKVFRRITKTTYYQDRSPSSIKLTSRAADRRLGQVDLPDVIITTQYPTVALSNTKVPIIFWNDSTFAKLIGFYPGMDMPVKFHYAEIVRLEKRAFDKAAMIVFTSQWAAKGAMDIYGIPAEKIQVIPYGLNSDHVVKNQAAKGIKKQLLVLLAVGVDWHRKGLDLACELLGRLQDASVQCELHIVGCLPTKEQRRGLGDNVVLHGFLSKDNPQENIVLLGLYQRANFLVFPSRAECFGMVIAEANSFGVPVITSDVGGISTPLASPDGGYSFAIENWVNDATVLILDFVENPDRYEAACNRAYLNYTQRLTWDHAVAKFMMIISSIKGSAIV